MKKTLTLLSMSACVLLAFNSCSSSRIDEDDYESATIASDSIADGEIPPWLIDDEDDGWGAQVSAGATTHDHFPIPEPHESVSDVYGSGARQNQPTMADQSGSANVHRDAETIVETPTTPAIAANTPGTLPPVAVTPVTPTPTRTTTPTTPTRSSATTSSATTRTSSSTASSRTSTSRNNRTASNNRNNRNNRNANNRTGRRYTEPTLLTYRVRPGDNLSVIARRSRTTVAQIKRDSGLTSDTIYPGQVIKVRYIPRDYQPGRASNNSSTRARSHTVARGETIAGIAKQYGVPYTDILKANNMTERDAMRMRPGRRLTIPGTANSRNNRRNRR